MNFVYPANLAEWNAVNLAYAVPMLTQRQLNTYMRFRAESMSRDMALDLALQGADKTFSWDADSNDLTSEREFQAELNWMHEYERSMPQ